MRAASRDSLASATERFDATVGKASVASLRRQGEELHAVLRLLEREPVLRRHLADPAASEPARVGLLDAVLSKKVAKAALEVVRGLVRSRWSAPADLLMAVEHLARLATLAVAEKDGSLEEVEDELFRFGRILDGQARLRTLLADPTTAPDRRVELLDAVLAGRVQPVTTALLTQSVRSPRGRSLDRVAEQLAELAAARRDRYVAHVTVAAGLSDDQEQRLARTLGRIYGREISVQVEIDPQVLGGLVVRVGDEVIDGSVSGRLAEVRQRLAG